MIESSRNQVQDLKNKYHEAKAVMKFADDKYMKFPSQANYEKFAEAWDNFKRAEADYMVATLNLHRPGAPR